MHPKFERDRFLVNQKFAAFGSSKYYVYDEESNPILYVERPIMRLLGRRADVTVYDDEATKQPLLIIRQEQGWEWRRRDYTLVDLGQGEQIVGRLLRDNFKALFLRRWEVNDASGRLVARAREDSTFMAVLRRVVDFIPFVGAIGFALLKTDFHILAVGEDGAETKAGEFNRKIGIGDKYVLDLSEDAGRALDRRLCVALGILLDTAEAR